MNRPLQRHLDDEEIEALSFLPEDRRQDGAELLARLTEEVLAHLAGCSECDRKLRMNRDGQSKLNGLRLMEADEVGGNCPEGIDWTALASGSLPEAQALTNLGHASKCSHCGLLLKTAIADLSDQTTSEEEVIWAGLKSSSPEWQVELAKTLQRATASLPGKKRFNWKVLVRPPSLIFAAALLLAIFGTIAVLRSRNSDSPAELVASAYSAHRTMDLRIPGAAYSPKRVERSSLNSNVDRPVPLLRAEELIHEGLLKNPNDVVLLDAKARADLLDGSPETAIVSLQRALETTPDSQVLLTDLASAFFMRAERENSAIDYGRAIDLLGKVLTVSPNDPVALFNRALTEDRLLLFNDEIRDWARFLQVEKDPGWSSEGKALLDAVQKKYNSHVQSSWIPRHSAATALAAIRGRARSPDGAGPEPSFDEIYLPDAISDWLPSVAARNSPPEKPPEDDLAARQEVLDALAGMFRTQHRDTWLSDLVAGPRSRPWVAGVLELGTAQRADSNGNVAEMLNHAALAAADFKESGNAAGESAAALEFLTGTALAVHPARCLELASEALVPAISHHYAWIESSILYQASTCNFMIGKQETALQNARRAALVAKRAHYEVLSLLGAYFLDGVTTTSISTADSWNRIRDGLAEFWSAPYPPRSGEGFYSDLGFAAQNEGLWHCAESTSQESLIVHSAHEDQLVIAGAHHRLAKAAEAAGDNALAEEEYGKASDLLSHLGNVAKPDRVELEIERAALEVRLNKFQNAALRLQTVRTDLSEITNHYTLIPYYEAVGEVDLFMGKSQQAEGELLQAIRLIEQDKSSVRSQSDLLTWQRDTAQAYRTLLRLYSQSYHDDSMTFSFLEWYRAGPVRPLRLQKAARSDDKHALDRSQFLPSNIRVPAHTAVLTWISFPTNLSAFLLDETGLHVVSVPVSQVELNAITKRLIRLCSDPLSDRLVLERDARQLYQWLVQPMAGRLGNTEDLIIEPDESFGSIPFEILESPLGNYLGDLYSISESPGLGYGRMLRTSSRISSKSVVLAVGDPLVRGELSHHFGPLPEAGKEAANVSADFDNHFLLVGSDATLQSVVKLLPRSDVFHFAGHAVSQGNQVGLMLSSPPGNPDHDALLDSGQIRSEELKRLKLVVLSGCETGIAEHGFIDPKNLVGEFLKAGVPNVVASKWQIDSQTSVELMSQVYLGLMRGIPIQRALTAARKSIRSNPNTAHPYYWAAFSVFGK